MGWRWSQGCKGVNVMICEAELRKAIKRIHRATQLNPQLAFLLAWELQILNEALRDKEWVVYYP